MHDVVTIGSATIDLFLKSPKFHLKHEGEGVLLCEEYGGKLDISEFEMQSGGAGTNTAVGFSRLGLKAAAVVEIGKDMFAQTIFDELKRDHVTTDYVVSEKSERTAMSILLIGKDGGRSALTYRGAAACLEPRDIPWQLLTETRWVHLSNTGGNVVLLLRIFDHLRSTKIGLSWNPGRKELELLEDGQIMIEQLVCDVFFVNKEEWKIVQSVQHKILRHIPYVVVTDGQHGGTVYLRDGHRFSYQAQHVDTVQETGAGDAFVVGFIAAHLAVKTPEESAQWGVKNATSVVQHMGAKTGLLHKHQISLQ